MRGIDDTAQSAAFSTDSERGSAETTTQDCMENIEKFIYDPAMSNDVFN
jgi:hypothetical protein